MPHVFVHGNPETEAIWWPLAEELRARGIDDVVLLSPPGFGAPVPAGWDATYLSYRDWLVTELERIGGDVHLVGHDWGAGHVYSVVAHRPDLLVSWAADCGGLLHPDYVWHSGAQEWQTPGLGEQVVSAMLERSPQQMLGFLAKRGISGDIAAHMAAGTNADMGRCILGLYRSATQPAMRDLGLMAEHAVRRPGLVIIATEDAFVGTASMAENTAERLGARTATLDGAGHWWMLEQPAAAANSLCSFWAAL